jgi:NAD-dependent DNA ligase
MANIYSSYEEFLADYQNQFLKLRQVEGFGETMVASLLTHFDLLLEAHDKFNDITFEQPAAAAVTGEQHSICITGTLEHPRSYYQNLIESNGHIFVSSVTKKTTHLLAGEKAGSKLKKAQDLGVIILKDEAALLEAIQG